MDNKKAAEDLTDYFKTYFGNNLQKVLLALKKAVKERELARQKAANLLILRQELKALTKEREKIAALVEKHEIYPRFLDKVVIASKQFQEVWQVMSRLDTLVQIREELLTSTKQNQECCETARTQLTQYLEQSEDSCTTTTGWPSYRAFWTEHAESRWAHIQNTATTKTLLLSTIKMATLN
ncbi:unnamed protein product, partial [Coregonus sp. 'balchen']